MAKFLSDSGLLTLILKIKEEFDSIYETIIDDEKVTASALIDINTKYTTLQDELDTKSNKTPIVSHGTSDTTFTLTPNVYHIWGEVSTLTLTLGAGESGYLSEYMFEFQSGSTPTTLTLPNTVEWPSTPTIESNKRYLVSIVNNIALMVGV